MIDKENNDVNIEVIAKLIELTRENKIQWIPADASTVIKSSDSDIIDSVFIAEYKKKLLRIYSRKYKALSPMAKLAMSISHSAGNESLSWYKETVLEIINSKHISLWKFPSEEILNDLLKSIKYKISGAEELIQDLLSEN